ncbi:hypothetical protein HK104_000722 [Borealophlyctis nickersoniae]|nr:hypothetical protein HK104_000722 [Borealophlyctis nickersoniae]
MAQGNIKKSSSGAAKKSEASKKQRDLKLSGPKKRAGKYVAPKKQALISQKSLSKKLAARSITQTEKLMAARAGATGKLTIMKPVAEQAKAEGGDAKGKK